MSEKNLIIGSNPQISNESSSSTTSSSPLCASISPEEEPFLANNPLEDTRHSMLYGNGGNKTRYPDVVPQKDKVALAEIEQDNEEDEDDEENELEDEEEEEEEEDVDIEEEEDEDEALMEDDTMRLQREHQRKKLEQQQRHQQLHKSTQRYHNEVILKKFL